MNKQWEEARRAAGHQHEKDLDLLLKKAADYSTNNIHAVGTAGVASRLVDKFARLQNLLTNGEDPQVLELLDETLSDARNYCTILALKRDGKWPRMIRSVYIAGPIDDAKTKIDLDVVFFALLAKGLAIYSPRHAFQGASFTPDFVALVNRSTICASDAMLVYWPSPDPSFGTGRDVEYARQAGKPVFVVAPWCHSTELHDCHVYNSIADAATAMAP